LSRIIAPVALAGLLASAAWHLGILAGHDFLGEAGMVLFVGIFVVWFPTVMSLQKLAPALQRGGSWKVLLAGAPDWVKTVVGAVFIYAMINFGLGFVGVFATTGPGFWRIGSGHAMAFYAAAWGLSLAAVRREELGIEWKCQNGHDMSPIAKFCDECGAPARPGLASRRAGV
jgi:hypothetical protein